MSGVGLIMAIIIGILAGWIAEKVMRRNHGILMNLVVGVVGMLRGGEFNRKYGNKLMRLRVLLQGVALLMIVLFLLLSSA